MKTPTDVLIATLTAICRYVIVGIAGLLIKHGLVDAETLSAENIGILAVGLAGVIIPIIWTYKNKLFTHHLLTEVFHANPATTTIDQIKENLKKG